MTILGICILFNATVLMTTAILQAHGHVNLPVVNMFVGGIVKLAAVFILSGNPNVGILGTPIGSLLCYMCITVLNLFSLHRVLPKAPAIVRNMAKSVFAALLMGAAVLVARWGLYQVLGAPTGRGMTALILCGGPILLGVVVYVVSAIKLRAITREDCLLLPKGEKIAKLLHL